jgi:hypothetical protein
MDEAPKKKTTAKKKEAPKAEKLPVLTSLEREKLEARVAHLKRQIPFLERLDERKRVEQTKEGLFDGRQYQKLIPKLHEELRVLEARLA